MIETWHVLFMCLSAPQAKRPSVRRRKRTILSAEIQQIITARMRSHEPARRIALDLDIPRTSVQGFVNRMKLKHGEDYFK